MEKIKPVRTKTESRRKKFESEYQVWKEEKGGTLVKLADLLGVTQSALSQFKNGDVPIPESMVIDLAIVMEIPVKRLDPTLHGKLLKALRLH